MKLLTELIGTDEYWQVQFELKLYNLVEDYRAAHDLTPASLAARAGVSERVVRQVLNGTFDGRLSVLIRLVRAVGHVPDLHTPPLPDYLTEFLRPLTGSASPTTA